ncbi:PSD1 and planctomycete cytochrome C domain-containing protein [Akkermansiaceae bacterium]|nr:PSD1 and planctomycete cytochrome C domain-containing protein [Akkermansiaceae bacterium]
MRVLAFIFLFIVSGEASVDFNRDIRPILSDKCFHCHGPDEETREAELRLDTYKGATEGGEFEVPIEPGKPAESEVIARILNKDPDEIMPPPETHKKVTAKELELLKQWIKGGAEYDDPWTYKNPVKQPDPEVQTKDWPINFVDRFILSRLEKEAIPPSPDADPVTLLRRLQFDLIGLPPTPGDLDRFLNSFKNNPQAAIETEVDRLLASPHFGERLAIYWLDLVRYADTVGYHGDQDHNISPYRDYVIRAFNENMPFDRFTREQLAGDLLEEPTKQQRVATGYNRLLQTTHEGGLQKAEYRAIYQADRVRNVSAVWMGATVGCAQCHDHKYDPYTAKDFHTLGAFFADIDDEQHFTSGTNALPTRRPPEIPVMTPAQQAELDLLNKTLNELSNGQRNEIARLIKESADRASRAKKARDPKEKKNWSDGLQRTKDALAELISPKDLSLWKNTEARRLKVESSGHLTMITQSLQTPRVSRVFPRGNWLDESGEIVQPAVPHFLPQITKEGRQTRLDLANWLTDSKNGTGGLTARVMSNRLFYLFFGTGISRSLGDFGGQGQPPSNPELLDRLAIEFYESNWDIKKMVKILVTSRAYRQSSLVPSNLRERDPYNELFARQARFRLPAEMIRDNALALAGLLVTDLGGSSVKPYQPSGYYRHLNFPPRKYKQDTNAKIYRRGLYIHWQRQFLHPMLRAFDAPSREECTAKRPKSNTPVAALNLLNDPTFVEAARVFAERIIKESKPGNLARLHHAFKIALNREPTTEERDTIGQLITYAGADFRKNPKSATALINIGQTKPGDSDPALLATWTTVARAILNLSETTTRN